MEAVAEHSARPETGSQLDNRRIAAGAIDLAVVAAVGLVLKTLTGGFGAATLVLTVGWGLYYFFALEWTSGQTLGKRVMRLRVARADGDAPGIRETAIRTVLRVVDGIGFYVVGLGAMLATGDRRQRLGDLAAGTVVTTADSAPAEPAPVEAPAPVETPAPVEAPAPAEAPAPVVESPAPTPIAEEPTAPAPIAEEPSAPTPVAEEPSAPPPIAEEPAPPAPVEQTSSPPPAEHPEEASPEIEVKPMETVSPLELLMAESEQKPADEAGPQGPGDAGQSD